LKAEIISSAKPFLKWAGGKGQLLNKFESFFPPGLYNGEIENYYEPFLGGGAVFFHIKSKGLPIKNFYLFDVNEELIRMYRVIQRDVSELIKLLKSYKKKYYSLSETKEREDFYKDVRDKLNKKKQKVSKKYSNDWKHRTAQLIFLNKTCYNGLFRVNKSGDFNVPFGNYKNPQICDEINLIRVNEALQGTEIEVRDFRKIVKGIKNHSFVYFDPPYLPLNKTSSFTAYSKFNFGLEEQKQLAELFVLLNKKYEIKLMLSNSDPDGNFFSKHYQDNNIFIRRVKANRMINCAAEKRCKISELVITNYNDFGKDFFKK
jgi:DNA adenine methylase